MVQDELSSGHTTAVLGNPLVVGPGAQAVGPPQQLDREPGAALAAAPAKDRPATRRAHALSEAMAALAAAIVRLKCSLHSEDLFGEQRHRAKKKNPQLTRRSPNGFHVGPTLSLWTTLWLLSAPRDLRKTAGQGPLTSCLARGNSTSCVRAQIAVLGPRFFTFRGSFHICGNSCG